MVTETTHCEQIHFAKINVNEIFTIWILKRLASLLTHWGELGI